MNNIRQEEFLERIEKFYRLTFGYEIRSFPFVASQSTSDRILFARINRNFVSLPHFSHSLFYSSSEIPDSMGLPDFREQDGIISCSDPDLNWEIRSFNKLSRYFNDDKVVSFLELEPTIEAQWRYFSSSLRNNVKKAEKLGITTRRGGVDLLDSFYQVYSKNMHDLGSPAYGKDFFQTFMTLFPNETKIIISAFDGKPVGCSFFVKYGPYSEICWASSLRKYNRLNTNYMVYWDSIQHAIESGCSHFSFGRSTKDSPSYKFKHHWKPLEKTLYFNYSHPRRSSLKDLRILSKVWSVLPPVLTSSLGPKLMKRLY